MKGLAELVVSLCDLCEAEGRLLEAGILRTVRRAALLSLGLLFGAGALALLLAALYALLTSLLPTPAALALLGCASAAIAGVFFWNACGGAAKGAAPGTAEKEAAQESHAVATVGTDAQVKPAASPAGEKADDGHAPWADVPPYGHSSHNGKSSGPRQGASPERPRAPAGHGAADRKNR